MREQSLVPTTLPDWPRVCSLLPEQKLIYGLGFWAGRYTNSIGIAAIPMRPLAASLGLDPVALETGIRTLCDAQLLVADWESQEFFIRDWFRYHKFKGVGVVIARQEFSKLTSPILRNAVVDVAPWLAQEISFKSKQKVRSPTATATATASSSSAEKTRIRRASGIVTYTPTDPERAREIEDTYSSDQIKTAVTAVEMRSKEPVPGLVLKEIEDVLRAKAQAEVSSVRTLEGKPVGWDDDIRKKDMSQIWQAIGKEPPSE